MKKESTWNGTKTSVGTTGLGLDHVGIHDCQKPTNAADNEIMGDTTKRNQEVGVGAIAETKPNYLQDLARKVYAKRSEYEEESKNFMDANIKKMGLTRKCCS